MKIKRYKQGAPGFTIVYELLIWVFYVCLYKYSYYLEKEHLPLQERSDFPRPQLIIYAVAMTLYIIPLYRWLVPALLQRKKVRWLALIIPLYMEIVPKFTDWAVNAIFIAANSHTSLHTFFINQGEWYIIWLSHVAGWDLQILLIDLIAFLSVSFMIFAFENEQKKRLLEKDNLVLQLEALKAQLHPHFLFNTLNSIYGMSLSGSPETPDFILKLSDMMRFILYDCRHHHVPLEKDIEFMENYFAMEKKRYPSANIRFTIAGEGMDREIAPLLFIPFVENSFKHGAHRVLEQGQITGHLRVEKDKLHLMLENDVLVDAVKPTSYRGVGVENVRRRLDLYYPGQHVLDIRGDRHTFKVELTIRIKP